MQFDHVGIPIGEKREGMRYFDPARSWLTSPDDHPFRAQFLYFEPDSPAPELVRTVPHIAYRVDDLEEATAGRQVVFGPLEAFGTLRVAFVDVDGAVIELIQPL